MEASSLLKNLANITTWEYLVNQLEVHWFNYALLLATAHTADVDFPAPSQECTEHCPEPYSDVRTRPRRLPERDRKSAIQEEVG